MSSSLCVGAGGVGGGGVKVQSVIYHPPMNNFHLKSVAGPSPDQNQV